MRILIAWDNPSEAELLQLYLGTGDNEALVLADPAEIAKQAEDGNADVLLLSLTFPQTADQGFALFDQLARDTPDFPVVIGCRPSEILSLPRFMMRGLRFHITRDERGEFVFLALSSLESAVMAARAEQSRKLAERLREEMDSVRRLQESILPKGLKAPAGYAVAARYEPAQVNLIAGQPVVMAGGDYYDLFCPDDRTLIVILGDAAGHGLKACMSIMTMHTLIRMFRGEQYRQTGRLVAEVNDRLCESSIVQSGGGFITLFYAAIDTVDHVMTWTSAGHPLALVQDLGSGEVTQVGTDAEGGLPLGISPGLDYPVGRAVIPANSRLLIYTDGLTDAFPQEGESVAAYGVRGIHQALKAVRGRRLEEALAHLFAASGEHAGESGRHDDTSVVLMERGGEG